jgi:DNA-binding LacI/PurR family transcriptional regulator
MDAIDTLGYRVNLAARNLRTNQTRTIAIVIPTISEPVINRVVEAVEDTAINAQYSLLMCSTRGDTEREKAYIRLLTQQTLVDGILYVSPRAAPEDVRRLLEGDAPVVLCNYRVEGLDVPSVMADHVQSIYQTTHYLLTLGHTRIALLNLSAPHYQPARMRHTGFITALANAGLTPEADLIVELEQPTFVTQHWRNAIHTLLDRDPPPSAIVAFNDQVALEVYAVCRERGLSIPNDLSVTGCDDILFAQYVDPPLTTVRIPADNQGRTAMQILLKQLEQPAVTVPAVTMLDVELVVRESCAAPRA